MGVGWPVAARCYGLKVCCRTSLPPWKTCTVALVNVAVGVCGPGQMSETCAVVTRKVTVPFSGRRFETVPETVCV